MDFCDGALLSARCGAVAQSGQELRHGAKAGVRVDDSKHLFCVSLAMRAFADVQPSLLLLVHLGHIAPA